MRVTLIRHGTTTWNEAGRYQGWKDIGLSDTGIREAQALQMHLADEYFDAIVASDLTRCLDTARLVFPHATILPDPAFREISFGAWEGCTASECLISHPDAFQRWTDDPGSIDPPDGEPLAVFERRIHDALDALPERFGSNAHVAVVTHGGAIRAAVRRAHGSNAQDAYRLPVRQCSVTRLTIPAISLARDSAGIAENLIDMSVR